MKAMNSWTNTLLLSVTTSFSNALISLKSFFLAFNSLRNRDKSAFLTLYSVRSLF